MAIGKPPCFMVRQTIGANHPPIALNRNGNAVGAGARWSCGWRLRWQIQCAGQNSDNNNESKRTEHRSV
jgi:hypothetical protein